MDHKILDKYSLAIKDKDIIDNGDFKKFDVTIVHDCIKIKINNAHGYSSLRQIPESMLSNESKKLIDEYAIEVIKADYHNKLEKAKEVFKEELLKDL